MSRIPDRIGSAPRYSAQDAVRLNDWFDGASTAELLRDVLTQGQIGEIATVSSFGAESAVLLHLVSRIAPDTPVLFLDTGKHFAETLTYRDTLIAALGLTDLRILTPDPQTVGGRDFNGLRWSFDPDGCCEIRKVAPLGNALAGFDASLTGRKAFQSDGRAALPRFEVDTSDGHGRLKINPLIDWVKHDIAAFFDKHDLPRHPLVSEGYPSIGCSPCTSKVAAGEDPRAGRWKGWDKSECGIHTPLGDDGDLPPGYEPFL